MTVRIKQEMLCKDSTIINKECVKGCLLVFFFNTRGKKTGNKLGWCITKLCLVFYYKY